MLRFSSLFVALFSLVVFTTIFVSAGGDVVVIRNCTDTVNCDSSSCIPVLTVPVGVCTPMSSAASYLLLPGKYIKVVPSAKPGLCSPTQVYFGDPTCSPKNISSVFWTPDGACLQYSPRLQTATVKDDQFLVFVQSCADATCANCSPISPTDKGLPPKVCYAHPGVPGLYLRYPNLESCTQYDVTAYDDAASCDKNIVSSQTAKTIFAGQGKCFAGVRFDYI